MVAIWNRQREGEREENETFIITGWNLLLQFKWALKFLRTRTSRRKFIEFIIADIVMPIYVTIKQTEFGVARFAWRKRSPGHNYINKTLFFFQQNQFVCNKKKHTLFGVVLPKVFAHLLALSAKWWRPGDRPLETIKNSKTKNTHMKSKSAPRLIWRLDCWMVVWPFWRWELRCPTQYGEFNWIWIHCDCFNINQNPISHQNGSLGHPRRFHFKLTKKNINGLLLFVWFAVGATRCRYFSWSVRFVTELNFDMT